MFQKVNVDDYKFSLNGAVTGRHVYPRKWVDGKPLAVWAQHDGPNFAGYFANDLKSTYQVNKSVYYAYVKARPLYWVDVRDGRVWSGNNGCKDSLVAVTKRDDGSVKVVAFKKDYTDCYNQKTPTKFCLSLIPRSETTSQFHKKEAANNGCLSY